MATASSPRSAPARVSLEQYLAGPPDAQKTELLYGERIVSPRPTDEHNDLIHEMGEVIKRWTRFHHLGKVSYDIDMVLDEELDLAYAPDLLFVAHEHEDRRRDGRLYGPADLCVEIASPSDKPRVARAKYRDYARYGVAWYWIVNALGDEPMLEENELRDGEYVTRTEIAGNAWFAPALFPGLQFRLPALIEGDLKAAVKGKAKKLM